MLYAESDISIDRPVDDVFEIMTDVDRVPMWMTAVVESRQTPPDGSEWAPTTSTP